MVADTLCEGVCDSMCAGVCDCVSDNEFDVGRNVLCDGVGVWCVVLCVMV